MAPTQTLVATIGASNPVHVNKALQAVLRGLPEGASTEIHTASKDLGFTVAVLTFDESAILPVAGHGGGSAGVPSYSLLQASAGA